MRPRKPTSRPFVLVNMAMSADGKLATANRKIVSVGSQRDLAHLYELRATADAVMSGARTIEESKATLGDGGPKYLRARLRRGLRKNALRIIVSGRGTVSKAARIFHRQSSAPLLILTTTGAGATRIARLRKRAEVVVAGSREINWSTALRWLRDRFGVRRLLCEGGGELNDSLFRADVVDELHLTICPSLIGGQRAPSVSDGRGFARLAEAVQLELTVAKRVNDEIFLVYQRAS